MCPQTQFEGKKAGARTDPPTCSTVCPPNTLLKVLEPTRHSLKDSSSVPALSKGPGSHVLSASSLWAYWSMNREGGVQKYRSPVSALASGWSPGGTGSHTLTHIKMPDIERMV